MKRILLILLFPALSSGLFAQLDFIASDDYSAVGDTGVAVHGYVSFWKDTTDLSGQTGVIKLSVDNLSVYQLQDLTLSGFENGIVTGFGFAVGDGFTWEPPMEQPTDATAIANMAPLGSTDAIHFQAEEPYFGSGVHMDIGADATSPGPDNGIAGGYKATFTFAFTTSSAQYLTDNFNFDGFFGSTANDQALFFRFQSVSSNGVGTQNSDKVFVTWDPGGGGFDNPVPEPSTYGLFGAMALLALVIARRKSR